MPKTNPKTDPKDPYEDPLYDPIKDEEEGPRTYIGEGSPTEEEIEAMIAAALGNQPDFSSFMTAADAEELFRNMDTGQIEANVLQKMGLPDFLTNTQVQDAISQALGATDFLSQEDVERMLRDQMNNQNIDLSDYVTSSDISGFLSEQQISDMIRNAQMQGMTEQQIMDMIKQVTGGQMSDDAIRELVAQTIADATAGVPGIDEIQRMIDEGLANGLSPEEINQMISEYLASNPIEGITVEAVQQMIADAIAGMGGEQPGETALTEQQIQDLIGQQGYLTEDQIRAMMGEAGYLGQEGVDASVQAALDAALGQGGAISSAIATALQNQQKYDVDTGPQTPTYTPPPAGDPYGGQNPYALMLGQNAGTTPFAGGTTTGAENPYGIAGLNLGNTADYNFNIPTTSSAQLYPTGISSVYSQPPNKGMPENVFSDPSQDPNNPMFYGSSLFNTYGG